AEYERTGAQFVAPERRTIHLPALPAAEAVQAFAEGAESGASFASVVSVTGLQTEVVEIGTLAEGEVTNATVAEAAFGLDENGYTVIEAPDGQSVVWVSAIQEGGQAPLETVRDQIAQDLSLKRA